MPRRVDFGRPNAVPDHQHCQMVEPPAAMRPALSGGLAVAISAEYSPAWQFNPKIRVGQDTVSLAAGTAHAKVFGGNRPMGLGGHDCGVQQTWSLRLAVRVFSPSTNLLAEIESRQDEVLARLDQLNAQLEAVLADWGAPAKSRELVSVELGSAGGAWNA